LIPPPNNGVAGSTWAEAVGGDGGQSDFGLDGVRGHTCYDAPLDFNFSNGTDITDWNWVADRGDALGRHTDRHTCPAQRFVSSIYIDPQNANHAWISFSGYDA